MTAGLAGGNDTHSKNAFIVRGAKTVSFRAVVDKTSGIIVEC